MALNKYNLNSLSRSTINNLIEIIFITGIIALFFYLQFKNLHLAAAPGSDEGVYAEAGRLMMEGLIPHKDFPIWHMPVLPIFIGLTLKISGKMYFVRLLFLLLNSLAIIPLYLTLRKISHNRGASLLAILFYITFYEMVRQDFRFIAIRQLANDLFILFLYLGLCCKRNLWTYTIQSILAVLSLMLFIPTVFNLVFISLSLSFSQPKNKEKLQQIKIYILIILPAIIAVILYFYLIPESLNQVVFGQLNRVATGRFERLGVILIRKDIYLYVISCIGLISVLFYPKNNLKYYALSMLCIIFTNLFLSSNFYPHYLSIAGPAFAFGILVMGIRIHEYFLVKYNHVFGSFIIYILLFSLQISIVFPALNLEWKKRHYGYIEIIDSLSKAPEPLLAMQPIFAVEANKKMIRTPIHYYFRAPNITQDFSQKDYENMAAAACSIFLEINEKLFPENLQKIWRQEFNIAKENNWGTVLISKNPICRSVGKN